MIEKRYFLVVLERINRLREYAMQPIIELNNIQFNYQPEDASPALKDVSFPFNKANGSLLCSIMVLVNQR